MKIRPYIKSVGGYLPKTIVTNDDLSKKIDTSDEWIRTRTGIKQRHIAEKDEFTSDMCAAAARVALKNANLELKDIDLIIVATTTPDKTFPSTAALTQAKLGIPCANCAAFDVQAVCSGFMYALSVGSSLLKTGNHKNALIIGADKMSSIVDWDDRSTCVLFGDGAGAVVLSINEDDNSPSEIIDFVIGCDGTLGDILYTDGGVSSTGKSGVVKMLGRDVFKHGIEKMISSIESLLKKNNLSKEDINFVVPHQANIRMIDYITNKLQIAEEKAIITVQDHANTSAATIPLALSCGSAKFKRGDYIVMTAAGGGFSWGSTLLRW